MSERPISAANRRNDVVSSLFVTFRHIKKVRPRRQNYSTRHVFPLVDMTRRIIHAAPRAARPPQRPGGRAPRT